MLEASRWKNFHSSLYCLSHSRECWKVMESWELYTNRCSYVCFTLTEQIFSPPSPRNKTLFKFIVCVDNEKNMFLKRAITGRFCQSIFCLLKAFFLFIRSAHKMFAFNFRSYNSQCWVCWKSYLLRQLSIFSLITLIIQYYIIG